MNVPVEEQVRVITTIGHVDHGKTTFVDYLLAANNIISSRMAGKIRYMDSREDEQQRGITMESSAVSLHFKVTGSTPDGGSSQTTYIINLIDTPGHVDFSSEVSTASRLCDGALVLLDVVEGVCTQTIAVLRQAWLDRVRPILVINKFDRLITELKLTPVEGYHHLTQLIEQVNAVMGSFFAGERMEDDLRWREERERRLAQKKENEADEADATVYDSEEFNEKDDEDLYFAPDHGNVIFASAIDGWGFRVGKFAQIYAAKLGIKESNLRRVLWGDFYLDPKTKRVISYKHLRGRPLKPLFVQFVLDNIWSVYDSVVLHPNAEKVTKIVSTLTLKIPPRDLKSKDTRQLLQLIFGQWLSLSTCTIQAVVDVIPAPSVAQRSRVPRMIYPELNEPTVEPKNKLERDLFSCNAAPDAFVTAIVSKMFAVTRKDLPENKRKPLTADELRERAKLAKDKAEGVQSNENEEQASEVQKEELSEAEGNETCLLGFARLYSGTIEVGTTLYCVLPKYNGALEPTHLHNSKHVLKATIGGLYTMMGKDLVPVAKVSAGNVFAIRGLEGVVWRNATLCSPNSEGVPSVDDLTRDKDCFVNLCGVTAQTSTIVRVAVESVEPADMPKVVRGLKLLSQSDPCVETFQQQTGEHVILGAGELHLERCLKDLRERFAKVEIQASKPIVPFRETAVQAVDMAPPKLPNAPRGTVNGASVHGIVNFTIRVVPLPSDILKFLQDNFTVLLKFQRDRGTREQESLLVGDEGSTTESDDEANIYGDVVRKPTVKPEDFWTALAQLCKDVGGEWVEVPDKIWAFGPRSVGGCLLVDGRKGGPYASFQRRSGRARFIEGSDKERDRLVQDFENSVETGFQVATFRGPLCAEPVEGLAYFVEEIQIDQGAMENESGRTAQVTGSLISAVKDACGAGLLDWSPRLKLAMYTCDIQASTDVLGKMYGVVARRRGRIVAEEMKEGTNFFTVTALLPVVESFGFADEIRKRTSGAASPQLIFSGYELLDQDPFWVPSTEEELEDLGEKADRSNVAKGYMDGVRKRKGMFVDKKIVEFAEKQRTRKR
ncbi:P-loop containing nucleoside triphosphate hydrolase protein [Rickenella mellea]|uniref:Ribosome assembly protein 1 n=1 Tax=Rickenella mellea TaxID=50990 RepID=A0A4Y7PQR1_9AGAM|nr:P-loop containing nucleoside triphosphate hydrolase protein [Rickenella mellea]